MQLDLTDKEAARALLRELSSIIENDRYPLSPRIRTLRGIRAKFPGGTARPSASETPTLKEKKPEPGASFRPAAPVGEGYRRSVPVTTISTALHPQAEQTSRSRQSSTDVLSPYLAAISAASGSTWWPHALHHTISRT